MADNIAVPKYINVTKIVSRDHTFYIDHISAYPAIAPPNVIGPLHGEIEGRFVMSASHAKEVLTSLAENIAQYEAAHGEIDPAATPTDILLN